jgi:hypothetical protein
MIDYQIIAVFLFVKIRKCDYQWATARFFAYFRV